MERRKPPGADNRALSAVPPPVPLAIIDALAVGGIDLVFGLPGGNAGLLFAALAYRADRIRTVLVRHESFASIMAEAHGRLTNRPGVVLGQGAFLISNAGIGILEAHLGSSPMVILADLTDGAPLSQHAPYQSGTGDYGSWDAKGAFTAITKRTMVCLNSKQAVQATQLALKHALAGDPGPVAVLYHSTALTTDLLPPDQPPILYPTPKYLPTAHCDRQAIPECVAMLKDADRPVIIAGNGVRLSRGEDMLVRLAHTVGAPVATTGSGKGVFPETDDLGLGVVGTFGSRVANSVVHNADLVLAIGTKLGPSDTANERTGLLDPHSQRLIQIDVEPLNAGWTYPVDLQVIGDAQLAMAAILEHYPEPGIRVDAAAALVAVERQRLISKGHRQTASPGLLPSAVIDVLTSRLPPDAVITCDAGENRLFMMHHFRTRAGQIYLQPAGLGGMGYAIPAALSARLVHPDRPVIAVCGDGGFAMTIAALLTAIEEQLPVVIVLFNNAALGWVLHGRGAFAANLGTFDYAAIARAIGCEGTSVTTLAGLADALDVALNTKRPHVLDVQTSLDESFKEVTSPVLTGAKASD